MYSNITFTHSASNFTFFITKILYLGRRRKTGLCIKKKIKKKKKKKFQLLIILQYHSTCIDSYLCLETCLGSMSTFQMLINKKKLVFKLKVLTFPIWEGIKWYFLIKTADISTQTSWYLFQRTADIYTSESDQPKTSGNIWYLLLGSVGNCYPESLPEIRWSFPESAEIFT